LASQHSPSAQDLSNDLLQQVTTALDDFKAQDIHTIDVRGMSSLSDYIVIASGTSTRHLHAMAENLVIKMKQAGYQPLGVEGRKDSDWVLVDSDDVIVHLMLPQARDFYNLEKLWETPRVQG
jgi:ribosome-associated protein